MIIPYSVDVPLERWPFANWGLMGLICLVSFGVWVNMAMHDRDTSPEEATRIQNQITSIINNEIDELEKTLDKKLTPEERAQISEELRAKYMPANNNANQNFGGFYFPLALQRGQNFNITQLITYQLVHADPFHLIGNMLFMFVFGNAVNAKLGHLYFLLTFFLTGFLGAIPFMLMSNAPLVGASGSIFGLIGAFVIFFPRNDVSVFYWLTWRLIGVVEISAYLVIVFYVAWDIIYTVVFASSGIQTGVAHVVHVAGAIFGFGIGSGILFAGQTETNRAEQNLYQMAGILPATPLKKKKKKKKIRRDEDEDYE